TREAEVDMRIKTRLAAFEEAVLGFSGAAAVAPWSAVPPPGAGINREESPFRLPPSEPPAFERTEAPAPPERPASPEALESETPPRE
ncbi:MAG: hypothetical protein FWG74_04395, partial [Planctomycetes bacterium]|nr:hypothetical protein [Planctomycetota bacterium]